MASRLQTFSIRDWTKGLNTSSDETLLDPRELSIADNVIFDTSGSRKTRGGFKMWGYVGIGVDRASSNKTRTLTVTINSGITINAADEIAVWTDGSYNSDYDIKKIVVDSITSSGANHIITYTATTNLTETTTTDTNIRIALYKSEKIIGIKDFWYVTGGSKTQKRVAVSSEGSFYSVTSSGSMSPITYSGTALSTPIAHCDFAVLGNKLVISFGGVGNKPVIWDGSAALADCQNLDAISGSDISGTIAVPDIEYMQVWNGRIWATDKADPDKIHYSDIQEPERWNGEGDSGALVVDPGDDDKSGITAIMPPIKGRLPFAKDNKLFQVVGEAPLVRVEKISKGIGSASHFGAVAIDQDEVFFASKKGFHTFSATSNFGDFEGSFLSNTIQREFNDLTLSNMAEIRGTYVPKLNSVIWAVSGAGASDNDRMYLYNVLPDKASWYKWISNEDEMTFTSLENFNDSNVVNLYVGTNESILLKYDEDEDYDLVRSDIEMRIKTGIIYVDNNISSIKGFKRIALLYKIERQDINFTVKVKVDNFDTQTKTVSRVTESDLLGSTFTLGSSSLGIKKILLPDPIDIEGYGHGLSIEILSDSQPLELYGYSIDWEASGDEQERSS